MKHDKPVSASSAATCNAHCDRRWNGRNREMEHTICPSMNCETMPGCNTEHPYWIHTHHCQNIHRQYVILVKAATWATKAVQTWLISNASAIHQPNLRDHRRGPASHVTACLPPVLTGIKYSVLCLTIQGVRNLLNESTTLHHTTTSTTTA